MAADPDPVGWLAAVELCPVLGEAAAWGVLPVPAAVPAVGDPRGENAR